MAAADSKYNFIKNNEFKESDSDSESVGLLLQEAAFRRHRRRALWPWIAHMIFFASSLSLFVTGTIRLRQSSTSEESIEPLWTREYAPVVKAVGQKHGWQLLGAFDQPSPWRGQPNAEVDKAWDDVLHSGVFSVTAEDVERIGKLENSTVMLPPESGGGYMASLEAVHQLHCLNMLRQFTFRDYYADKSEPFSDPFKLRTHIDHCTEMLRQTIMCNTDMHLITYNWVSHVDYAWPNFSINRQCRNWDNMKDWVAARTAHTTAEHGLIRRPPGAAVMDVNPVEYVHVGF